MVQAEWQELIRKKRAARDALIPEEWRLPTIIISKISSESSHSAFELLNEAALLTDREIDITENNTATSLTAKIASGELSSYDVATAFCKRAALVHQLVRPVLVRVDLFSGDR
jgi:amidase